MTRRRYRKADLVALYDQQGARCALCGLPLAGKRAEIDHRIALALGGADTLDNIQLVCRPCHRMKTSRSDVPAMAKATRRSARARGIRLPSDHPMPHGRAAPTKRTVDGRIVLRWRNDADSDADAEL